MKTASQKSFSSTRNLDFMESKMSALKDIWYQFCRYFWCLSVAIVVPLFVLWILSFLGFDKAGKFFYICNDYMDKFTIMTAFLTLGIVARNHYNNHKNQDEIKITLHFLNTNLETELPIKILRKDFTRSEIFGYLGALNKGDKFDIAYLKKNEFFTQILEVQNKKKDDIKIKISKDDLCEF